MNQFQFLEQFLFYASLPCNSYSFCLNSLISLQILSSWKTIIHSLRPQTNITNSIMYQLLPRHRVPFSLPSEHFHIPNSDQTTHSISEHSMCNTHLKLCVSFCSLLDYEFFRPGLLKL